MPSSKKMSVTVLYNNKPAGVLTKERGVYHFIYDAAYLSEPNNRPISITLPLQKEPYDSTTLFPPFINMLSEGANKRLQCKMLKIDENDYFSLLLATANEDIIGPISIKNN